MISADWPKQPINWRECSYTDGALSFSGGQNPMPDPVDIAFVYSVIGVLSVMLIFWAFK